jgi:hypothetical protein
LLSIRTTSLHLAPLFESFFVGGRIHSGHYPSHTIFGL